MEEEKAVGISHARRRVAFTSLYRSFNNFEPYLQFRQLYYHFYDSMHNSPQVEYGVQSVVLIDEPSDLLAIPF